MTNFMECSCSNSKMFSSYFAIDHISQRVTKWMSSVLQSWENFFVGGLVKFVPAVAYHFCLNLPATFSQPRTKKFSQLCTQPSVWRAYWSAEEIRLREHTICEHALWWILNNKLRYIYRTDSNPPRFFRFVPGIGVEPASSPRIWPLHRQRQSPTTWSSGARRIISLRCLPDSLIFPANRSLFSAAWPHLCG